MWKYVSRRVKDTLERTCHVLDVGRTSFCSSSGVNGELTNHQDSPPSPPKEADQDKQVLVYRKRRCGVSWFRDRSRFSSRQQQHPDDEKAGQSGGQRERLNNNHHEGISQSWLGAITWSSAIVCGWYTSQYICMRRKRMGWTRPGEHQPSSCIYANVLLNTTRSLHTNISSRVAFAAPAYPGIDATASSIGALLQNVNHPLAEDHSQAQTSKEESLTFDSGTRTDRSSSSLDSAVAEFSSTIGEIEYQFGVQDLMAKDYKSAVNHLKLATTHHHSAATFNLGLCYEKGLGLDRDMKMAMECYQVASSLGHPMAMYNLGVFYVRGWGGLKRSRKAARECFDSAARLGQKEAQLAMDLSRLRQMQRNNSGRQLEPQLVSAWKDVPIGVQAF